jgi:aminoglycoside 6-adenylyltransferase
MNQPVSLYEAKAIAWAKHHPAIRVILVAGSRARTLLPGDEWADLDLEIYITDYTDYFANGEFIAEFGEVWLHLRAQTTDGDPQHLLIYAGGDKVDFTFFPENLLVQQIERQKLFDSQYWGYRVLIDKDNLTVQLPPPQTRPLPYPSPTAETFIKEVTGFWFGAIYIAKQLRRRNLWVAKTADWRIKPNLFNMMEWHAQAQGNWQVNTWHGGHFLHSWTDEETWRALHKVFGHFEAVDSWQALLGSMDLFRRLAQRVAQNLNYAYPSALDEKIAGYIRTLFEEDH